MQPADAFATRAGRISIYVAIFVASLLGAELTHDAGR